MFFFFLLPLLLLALWGLWTLARDYLVRPRALGQAMARQGIACPPRRLMLGNLKESFRLREEMESRSLPTGCHDIQEHVLPHIVRWSKEYGDPFFMWWATEPRLVIHDLDMIKEVLYNKSGIFWRSPLQQKFLGAVLGKGLVVMNGEEWALSRRVVSPAFHAQKIKGMVGTMTFCVDEMLSLWDRMVKASMAESAEIEVNEQFSQLTADVISRIAFGTSFGQGRRTLELLQGLLPVLFKSLTSPWNLRAKLKVWRIGREMDSILKRIIQARRDLKASGKQSSYGDDLLGLVLEEAESSTQDKDKRVKFADRNIIDECKTFYVAGHETTATLLTWTAMLLALNPTWQEQARSEVLQVCKQEKPNAETLNMLKTVGMVLNEALRLYPPAVFVLRQAYEDTKLGELLIPAGVVVHIPILDFLRDPELWGPDANEFNPARFENGVSGACKHPFAFMPFSHGPRNCVGQGFALMEAKIAIAMLLQRFVLRLSPVYRHCPALRMSLKPKHGMHILVSPVDADHHAL